MLQHRSDRRGRRALRGVEQQHDDDEPQPDPNGIGERDDDDLQQQAQRKVHLRAGDRHIEDGGEEAAQRAEKSADRPAEDDAGQDADKGEDEDHPIIPHVLGEDNGLLGVGDLHLYPADKTALHGVEGRLPVRRRKAELLFADLRGGRSVDDERLFARPKVFLVQNGGPVFACSRKFHKIPSLMIYVSMIPPPRTVVNTRNKKS